MKRLIILGSTGSIGTQTLDIVKNHPDKFQVVGLSCRSNIDVFLQQIKEFMPKFVVVTDKSAHLKVKMQLPHGVVLIDGEYALLGLVETPAEIVVNALVGVSGIAPTLRAIECKKHIALANKETLVACGDIVMNSAKQNNVEILPVDSEHSAIWQCLEFGRAKGVEKIVLTASGGPFRTLEKEKFKTITKSDALRHPTWNMGGKVTIDSATMMNKGLEVIEAMHLFRVGVDDIEIVVHPQSIVHSMVRFCDGSVVAHMSNPDMRLPIQLALSYPERLTTTTSQIDFSKLGALEFYAPDYDKFECLQIARDCARAGGLYPTVMNSANEVLVEMFLKDIIKFYQIPYYIKKTLEKPPVGNHLNIDDVFNQNKVTAEYVAELVRGKSL